MPLNDWWTRAGKASWGCALLTLIALVLGISIAARLGASSGMDVSNSGYEALMSIRPLLIAAELLKLASALSLVVVARSLSQVEAGHGWSRYAGYLGASFLFAAGLAGLAALSGTALSSAELGELVGPLGLVSAPLTGLWATSIQTERVGLRLPKWLRIAAVTLLLLGLGAVVLPPIGMLFGLVSLAWWSGLGRHALARSRLA